MYPCAPPPSPTPTVSLPWIFVTAADEHVPDFRPIRRQSRVFKDAPRSPGRTRSDSVLSECSVFGSEGKLELPIPNAEDVVREVENLLALAKARFIDDDGEARLVTLCLEQTTGSHLSVPTEPYPEPEIMEVERNPEEKEMIRQLNRAHVDVNPCQCEKVGVEYCCFVREVE